MVGCSKNRDPVTVGRVRSSRCCCPLPPIRPSVLSAGTLLLSTRRHLLAATSSGPLSPSDRFPWGLLWLRAQWLTLWWCRVFMPAASVPLGIGNPLRRVPVGLGSTSTMPHTLASVGSVSDLPLGRAYALLDGLHAPDTTSLMCALGPTSLSCWLLSPSPA